MLNIPRKARGPDFGDLYHLRVWFNPTLSCSRSDVRAAVQNSAILKPGVRLTFVLPATLVCPGRKVIGVESLSFRIVALCHHSLQNAHELHEIDKHAADCKQLTVVEYLGNVVWSARAAPTRPWWGSGATNHAALSRTARRTQSTSVDCLWNRWTAFRAF